MDYYEQIEAYLEDQLKEEDRVDYEIELARNPDLQEAVENFPLILEALEALVQEEAREALANVRLEQSDKIDDTSPKIVQLARRSILKYAAVAILGMCIGGYAIYNITTGNTPDQLYAIYYTTYPNLDSSTRSGSEKVDNEKIRANAFEEYDKGQFENVILLLTSIPSGYRKEMDDAFYIGISHLELEQWQEAISVLENVIDSNSEYVQEAEWYLALANIRSGYCEKGKTLLQEISSRGMDKSEEAEIIIRKINCE